MNNTVTKKEEPLTPEIVLGILRHSYQQQCQVDPEAEPGVNLSFESTVEEWRYACDLVDWKPLGRAMNKWFAINHSDDQWYEVLEPAGSQTLFAVCKLISSTATRLAVIPLHIFGNSCLEAGAFVTLRTSLANAGVPVKSIKPSTKLEPWLLKYWGEFSDVVGKLPPEALPPVEIEDICLRRLSYWLLLAGIVSGLTHLAVDHNFLLTLAASFFISGFLLILVSARMNPKRVSFGELETFGDVCRLISKIRK